MIDDQRPRIHARGGIPKLFDPLYVFGDPMFEPAPPEALRRARWQKFGADLAGEVVVINALSVENYFAATFRRSQSAGLTGAGHTGAGFQAMRAAGGTFDAVFVTISATFRGDSFTVVTVEPYAVNMNRLSLEMARSTTESREAAQRAVSSAIDDAIERVRPMIATAASP